MEKGRDIFTVVQYTTPLNTVRIFLYSLLSWWLEAVWILHHLPVVRMSHSPGSPINAHESKTGEIQGDPVKAGTAPADNVSHQERMSKAKALERIDWIAISK